MSLANQLCHSFFVLSVNNIFFSFCNVIECAESICRAMWLQFCISFLMEHSGIKANFVFIDRDIFQ